MASVEALNGVELLLPRAPGCPEVVCFGFFTKEWYVVFLPIHEQSLRLSQPDNLQIGNTHEHTVRRQICCLSRASGVTVVVSGPSTVHSWLLCSSGVWLRLFVARLWLAEGG